jgi:hypothetical protein
MLRFAAIGLVAILMLLAVASGSGFLLNRHSVSRASLMLSSNLEPQTCVKQTLPFYKQYNQELAANDYLIYAIASLNAYEDETVQRFVVTSYDKDFEQLMRIERANFMAIVYYKNAREPEAIVAIRGTRATSLEDWNANLSWFTAVLPVHNAYDVARAEFFRIREDLIKKAAGKSLKIVVTGHSLGGGLAQHIAAGFPCISAVVFDTSPVINRFVFDSPNEDAVTIHLHDRRDELTKIVHLFSNEDDSSTYRWYPLDLVPPGTLRHNITRFAVGMAGMTTDCRLNSSRKDCQIPAADTRAQDIYCPTFGHRDLICRNVIRRLGL